MVDNDLEEIVDVVDELDVVVGQATRREVHTRGSLHRAVHILLFDSDGDLVLQKRADRKAFNPARWTSTVSGHVISGASYEATASQEIQEELQLPQIPALNFVAKTLVEAHASDGDMLCRAWTTVYVGSLATQLCDVQPFAGELTTIEAFPPGKVLSAVRGREDLIDSCGNRAQFADNFRTIIELVLAQKGGYT